MAKRTTYNQIAGQGLGRLSALSDGVFAVALTLLVLDLKVPSSVETPDDGALLQSLARLLPRVTTYFLSFLTLGINWVGQQTQHNHLKHSDRNLTWLHLAFLASITLIPFSTSLLGAYIGSRLALVVYWANLSSLSLFFLVSWQYACGAGLMKPEVTAEVDQAVRHRVAGALVLYSLAMLFCKYSPAWSIGLIVLVQLNFALAPHHWRRFAWIRWPELPSSWAGRRR